MALNPEKSKNPPPTGIASEIAPGIQRIIAPNPSPMTYWGTNTYLIGKTDIAVIDPGPVSQSHLDAILSAVKPHQQITHILVTHAHLDHSPLARPLAKATGAKIYAYGDAFAGRSKVMQNLVRDGLTTGGEGVDHEFQPDILLQDRQILTGAGWEITAIWTPGHMANHLCFAVQDIVFTGDHVMGWASSLVSPPDGDLAQFMWSCARLQDHACQTYLPGHGDPVTDPAARIEWLIKHRKSREADILRALQPGPATVSTLTRQIYNDVPSALFPAAERNVFAHLIDLETRSIVLAKPHLDFNAEFSLK